MRTELKFGIFALASGIIWVLAEHLAGLNTTYFEKGELARGIFAFLPILFLVWGISTKKRKDYSGKISYLNALRSSSLIAFIYATGFAIWFWIYASLINIEFLQKSLSFEKSKLIANGLSGVALDEAMHKNTMMYGGSFFSYLMLFVSFFVMGILFSAVISIFMRTKKSNSE